MNLRGYERLAACRNHTEGWAQTNPGEGLYEFKCRRGACRGDTCANGHDARSCVRVAGIEAASSRIGGAAVITGVVGTLVLLAWGWESS